MEEEDNEFAQLKLDLQAKQTHADATHRHTGYLCCSSPTESPALGLRRRQEFIGGGGKKEKKKRKKEARGAGEVSRGQGERTVCSSLPVYCSWRGRVALIIRGSPESKGWADADTDGPPLDFLSQAPIKHGITQVEERHLQKQESAHRLRPLNAENLPQAEWKPRNGAHLYLFKGGSSLHANVCSAALFGFCTPQIRPAKVAFHPGGSASSRRGARLREKHQVDVPSDTVTERRDYHTRKACCKVNKAI